MRNEFRYLQKRCVKEMFIVALFIIAQPINSLGDHNKKIDKQWSNCPYKQLNQKEYAEWAKTFPSLVKAYLFYAKYYFG